MPVPMYTLGLSATNLGHRLQQNFPCRRGCGGVCVPRWPQLALLGLDPVTCSGHQLLLSELEADNAPDSEEAGMEVANA